MRFAKSEPSPVKNATTPGTMPSGLDVIVKLFEVPEVRGPETEKEPAIGELPPVVPFTAIMPEAAMIPSARLYEMLGYEFQGGLKIGWWGKVMPYQQTRVDLYTPFNNIYQRDLSLSQHVRRLR